MGLIGIYTMWYKLSGSPVGGKENWLEGREDVRLRATRPLLHSQFIAKFP